MHFKSKAGQPTTREWNRSNSAIIRRYYGASWEQFFKDQKFLSIHFSISRLVVWLTFNVLKRILKCLTSWNCNKMLNTQKLVG
jgi:hypothetical protein